MQNPSRCSNVITQFGFTYDASGDITTETGADGEMPSLEEMASLFTADMTYGPGNRLAMYNGESVQFDADGNMTHGPLSGAMVSFSYDSRRRLTQAGTTQYVYDAENNRIGVDGTRFVVNSQPALSQVLVKTAADGAQTFYVYGLGLIGEESAAGYKAYHFDFRGSTVALSDESGAVLERFGYSAYGVLLSGDASLTPFLFNGMYGVMTDGNGLYHMRARFYSAEIRRFLNRDVLLGDVAEGQSLNRFAYVVANPIRHIDPTGFDYWIEGGSQGEGGWGFHQSFCVGFYYGQKGVFFSRSSHDTYRHCISYGVVGNEDREECTLYGSCPGTIYPDYSSAGPIVEGSYRYTTLAENRQILEYISWYLWSRGNYNLIAYNCRDYSKELWEKINNIWLGSEERLQPYIEPLTLPPPPWER